MNDLLIASLIGVLSTVILHIAKAMERHGIEIFDQIRAKMGKKTGEEDNTPEGDLKKPTIYMVGFVLNQLTPVWMIIATKYGPPSYFTSMFGLGLIALMFYSAKILKEPIQRVEYLGAIILIVGTIVLGVEGMNRGTLEMSEINANIVWWFIGGYLILGIIGLAIGFKSGKPTVVGLLFGLFAGASGSLDPILKGIGQSTGGGEGFFPSTSIGWVVFLLSFLFGTSAFLFTQWGFAKKARASTLVPAYNSIYVVFPIIIQSQALPGFDITIYTIIGIIMVVAGITLMQAFKKIEPVHH